MAIHGTDSLENEVHHRLPEAYGSILQLLCISLDLNKAESGIYSSVDDNAETLKELAQKHRSDGVAHVVENVRLYEHLTNCNRQNVTTSPTCATFAVEKKRLQSFCDVTNDNVLRLLSKRIARLDRLQAFYNVYVTWLQSLSPPSIEWHFHVHSNHVLFCAKAKNLLASDFSRAIAIISYLLRTLSILLGFGDLDEPCLRRVNAVSYQCDGDLAHYLGYLLRFSYVNHGIPHVDWEFENVICQYDSPMLPRLDLYVNADVAYNSSAGLLSISSSYMTTVVCRACELIHTDTTTLKGDLLDVLVLCSVLARTSSNESTLNVAYRTLLKYIKELPTDVRRHGPLLESTFISSNAILNNGCIDIALCTEFYVKLTVTLMDDTNDKIYEVLEHLMDRLMLLKCQNATTSFLKCYPLLLESVPLACSATLIQLFDLLVSTVDTRIFNALISALECLEAVFVSLTEDANMFCLETCHWFLTPYMLHLTDAEISLVNTVLFCIQGNQLLMDLRFRPPVLEERTKFEKFSSQQRDEVKRRYVNVWKIMRTEEVAAYIKNRLIEFKISLEDQLRADGVASEGVLLISEYYSWLSSI